MDMSPTMKMNTARITKAPADEDADFEFAFHGASSRSYQFRDRPLGPAVDELLDDGRPASVRISSGVPTSTIRPS